MVKNVVGGLGFINDIGCLGWNLLWIKVVYCVFFGFMIDVVGIV